MSFRIVAAAAAGLAAAQVLQWSPLQGNFTLSGGRYGHLAAANATHYAIWGGTGAAGAPTPGIAFLDTTSA
jgi:hypothetical protein